MFTKKVVKSRSLKLIRAFALIQAFAGLVMAGEARAQQVDCDAERARIQQAIDDATLGHYRAETAGNQALLRELMNQVMNSDHPAALAARRELQRYRRLPAHRRDGRRLVHAIGAFAEASGLNRVRDVRCPGGIAPSEDRAPSRRSFRGDADFGVVHQYTFPGFCRQELGDRREDGSYTLSPLSHRTMSFHYQGREMPRVMVCSWIDDRRTHRFSPRGVGQELAVTDVAICSHLSLDVENIDRAIADVFGAATRLEGGGYLPGYIDQQLPNVCRATARAPSLDDGNGGGGSGGIIEATFIGGSESAK